MKENVLPYRIINQIGTKKVLINKYSTIKESKQELKRLKKENPQNKYFVWTLLNRKYRAFPRGEIKI